MNVLLWQWRGAAAQPAGAAAHPRKGSRLLRSSSLSPVSRMKSCGGGHAGRGRADLRGSRRSHLLPSSACSAVHACGAACLDALRLECVLPQLHQSAVGGCSSGGCAEDGQTSGGGGGAAAAGGGRRAQGWGGSRSDAAWPSVPLCAPGGPGPELTLCRRHPAQPCASAAMRLMFSHSANALQMPRD